MESLSGNGEQNNSKSGGERNVQDTEKIINLAATRRLNIEAQRRERAGHEPEKINPNTEEIEAEKVKIRQELEQGDESVLKDAEYMAKLYEIGHETLKEIDNKVEGLLAEANNVELILALAKAEKGIDIKNPGEFRIHVIMRNALSKEIFDNYDSLKKIIEEKVDMAESLKQYYLETYYHKLDMRIGSAKKEFVVKEGEKEERDREKELFKERIKEMAKNRMTVKVRRSSGQVDDDWRVGTYDEELDTVGVYKADEKDAVVTKAIKRTEFEELNS